MDLLSLPDREIFYFLADNFSGCGFRNNVFNSFKFSQLLAGHLLKISPYYVFVLQSILHILYFIN